ncbi:MAG: hypothetical protein HYZ45_10495 [Burkholderiales bacterium]|nr:hypothetical protein [Burkholderiales bacterium]
MFSLEKLKDGPVNSIETTVNVVQAIDTFKRNSGVARTMHGDATGVSMEHCVALLLSAPVLTSNDWSDGPHLSPLNVGAALEVG